MKKFITAFCVLSICVIGLLTDYMSISNRLTFLSAEELKSKFGGAQDVKCLEMCFAVGSCQNNPNCEIGGNDENQCGRIQQLKSESPSCKKCDGPGGGKDCTPPSGTGQTVECFSAVYECECQWVSQQSKNCVQDANLCVIPDAKTPCLVHNCGATGSACDDL